MKEQHVLMDQLTWKRAAIAAACGVLFVGVLNEADSDVTLQTTQGLVVSKTAGHVTVGLCVPETCSPTIAQLRDADLAATRLKNEKNLFDTHWKFDGSGGEGSCDNPTEPFVAQLQLGDVVVRERHQEVIAGATQQNPQYRQYCVWSVA